jgi:hypothetical protein
MATKAAANRVHAPQFFIRFLLPERLASDLVFTLNPFVRSP